MLTPTSVTSDTLELWNQLPEFAQANDEAGGYQFLTWLDGIVGQLQITDDLVRDDSNGDPGWSIVLDVTRCPTYALPWLAQFCGIRFSGAAVGNDAEMRALIAQPANWSRGTVQAIINALQPLVGNGVVNVIERAPNNDAYSVLIQIIGDTGILTYDELALQRPTYDDVATTYPTYNDMIGGNTAVVIAAAKAAMPAGVNVVVEFLT